LKEYFIARFALHSENTTSGWFVTRNIYKSADGSSVKTAQQALKTIENHKKQGA
jgi:hypothetical protein